MSDHTKPEATQQPCLLLGGFMTDPGYTYDAYQAQRCLAMAHELKLLNEYVHTIVAVESEDQTTDVLQTMSTPCWFAQWLDSRKIPELRVTLAGCIVGSDEYELADIALDNATYLREQLAACGVLVKKSQDEQDEQTQNTLLGE